MDQVNIGPKMREIRRDLGMTQAELARRAGVARNTVVLIEAGKRRPSIGLLEKFAHLLRTEPAELMREREFAGKGEAPRGAWTEEREEVQIPTWKDFLYLLLNSAAESGEEVAATYRAGHGWGHLLRWMTDTAFAKQLLEEGGGVVGDDPEVREAQERLQAVTRELFALVYQDSHTHLSSEEKKALRRIQERLYVPRGPSRFARLGEEQHSVEADRWIDYLDIVTERWLPQLWRALPPLEEGLPLEEVHQISREATDLAKLYIERRDAVRGGCSADQREALDKLEEALEEVLNRSATQFEDLYQKGQHEQQGIPNLTEMRKEQEEQKATAAAFHYVRHREASA
jgi:putative transcriptional regulator